MSKLVIVAAAVALIAAWFAPEPDGAVVGPAAGTLHAATPHADTPHAAKPLVTRLNTELPTGLDADLHIEARIADEEIDTLFAKQSWAQEMSKPALIAQTLAAPTLASNTAPVLPIHFVGHYIDAEQNAYFLQIDSQNVIVHVGDKVSDDYLLDSVNGDSMTFIYLPLNQKQTLVVGTSK